MYSELKINKNGQFEWFVWLWVGTIWEFKIFSTEKIVRKCWFPNAAIFSSAIMNQFIFPHVTTNSLKFNLRAKTGLLQLLDAGEITTCPQSPLAPPCHSIPTTQTCMFHVYVSLFLFSLLSATCTNCTRNSTCFTVGNASECICNSEFYQNVSTEMCISMATINTTSYPVSIL